MKPLLIALKGKGFQNLIKRFSTISQHYGITAKKMDRTLEHFGKVLSENNAGATFPIAAAALARNPGVIEKYRIQNIEFAVHGYYHIDHSKLSYKKQVSDFTKARQLFGKLGIKSSGFRSPYLRYRGETLDAVFESGFIYDSSSSLCWDVLNGNGTDPYYQALDFYGAMSADRYPSLPKIVNGLVQIPYSLPDDESLVERLHFSNQEEMAQPWLDILRRTYEKGELFTLGLHPERIYQCEYPLAKVLEEARKLNPKIWIARLDEIAIWWLQLAKVKPLVLNPSPEEYIIKVNRPQGLKILGRNVQILNTSKEWDGRDRIVQGVSVMVKSSERPFIGVSKDSHPGLKSFLRQNGYIVEIAEPNGPHSIFLDRVNFTAEEEKPLLEKLDNLDKPMIRFGRWPKEYRSALCITGDIDALTVWDYLLRVWRK